MTKKEARKYYLEQRMGLPEAERKTLSAAVLARFEKLALPPLKVAHVYQPILSKREMDTLPFIHHLEATNPGLTLAIPRVSGETDLQHFIWDSGTFLTESAWGIPEPLEGVVVLPEAIDLVLVPLLIFDKEGYRVGYGKGMYDRFLDKCRPDVVKIGLSLFEPPDRIEDRGKFDVPLSIGVTPTQLYEFV
jgi:5-formyltetrahydrofolate cyclo-ligase